MKPPRWPALMLAGAVLGLAPLVPAQDSPPSPQFLTSAQAAGSAEQERVQACLRLLNRELKLDDRELPRIVVIHASPQLARFAGMQRTTIRRVSNEDGSMLYELWMVGESNLKAYAVALQAILEQHFALDVPDEQHRAIQARVLAELENTVNARAPR